MERMDILDGKWLLEESKRADLPLKASRLSPDGIFTSSRRVSNSRIYL